MTIFRVRYGGHLPSGEVFNTGYHLSGVGSIDAAHAAAQNWIASVWLGNSGGRDIRADYSTTTVFDDLTTYELAPGTLRVIDKREIALTHPGTGLTNPLPQEVAIAVSFLTEAPGPAGRGRMFWPAPTVDLVTADGRLDQLMATGLSNNISTAFDTIGFQGWIPVLASVGRADRAITRVNVGDVFDAQRRRRDALVEVRSGNNPITSAVQFQAANPLPRTPGVRLAPAALVDATAR